jgi:hypothetical protein
MPEKNLPISVSEATCPVRSTASAELNVPPDLAVDLTGRILRVLEQRSIHRHHGVNLPRMDVGGCGSVRDLREEHRQKVRSARLYCVPDARPDEERDVAKAVLEPWRHVGGRAQSQQVDDGVIGEVIAVANEPVHERYRLGRARGDEDGPSPGDAADGLFGGDELGDAHRLSAGRATMHAARQSTERRS